MFKENKNYLQTKLFSFMNLLSNKKRDKLMKSEEYYFFKMIFCNIKEEEFSILYSEKGSRPNSPINAMVSALILMNRRGWTYEELFNRIDFDLLTRTALGLSTLDESPFSAATIFNFQNRLNDYYVKDGINLLEKVFDKLTSEQIDILKIKTDIQRTDSFLTASNIRKYSRIQLLVEILIRLHRVLRMKDKRKLSKEFAPYIKKTSGQYIYRLKREEVPKNIEEIGKTYYKLHKRLKTRYKEVEVFKIFERVYREHFAVIDGEVKVIPAKELTSDIVQSPDDLDAAYRKKGSKETRGQSINVIETATPENPINLITDVSVHKSNIDDSVILNERLDKINKNTPEIKEIHTDGGYSSKENDEKLEELGIMQIQTAVRGREGKVSMTIDQIGEGEYEVSCPHQTVKSVFARKRYRASFNQEICEDCLLNYKCPAIKLKGKRVYYFYHSNYIARKRQSNIERIPKERRKLRSNVEATVKEFKCKTLCGKLKVRGAFKTGIFAISMAASINFGRIYRFIKAGPDRYLVNFGYYFSYFIYKVKILFKKRNLLLVDKIL